MYYYLLFSTSKASIHKACESLNTEFKIEDEGELSKYLGIEINRQSYGSIHLRHPYLIQRIISSIPGLSYANKNPNPTTKPLMTKDKEGLVTGASVRAPRQSNSTYIQTVRRSIYDTRLPEHPHSLIRQYKRCLQVPPSRPRYMESCPDTALLYTTATYTVTSTTLCISADITITASTTPLCQEPAHLRISYPMLVPSSASEVSLVTVFNLISLTIFDFIRLNWGFV